MTRWFPFSRSAKPKAKYPDLLDQLGVPGTHEIHAKNLFKDGMMFEGDKPLYDRPLVVMAFTNRSGSNLLSEYVRQAGYVAGLGEFLNHPVMKNRSKERAIASLPDYICDLKDTNCVAPHQSLGIKASWDQLAMLLRCKVHLMFPKVIVLHVMRQDVLAQAVSYGIALQTGQWTSKHEAALITPKLKDADVSQIVGEVHRANLLIRLLTDAHGVTRFDVSYEQLTANPELHAVRVLKAAGLAGPQWTPRVPSLKKQSTDTNDRYIAQFQARLRDTL